MVSRPCLCSEPARVDLGNRQSWSETLARSQRRDHLFQQFPCKAALNYIRLPGQITLPELRWNHHPRWSYGPDNLGCVSSS